MSKDNSSYWRPAGWENPYQYELMSGYMDNKKTLAFTTTMVTMVRRGYEEGADAMLKALRENGYACMDGYEIIKGDTVIQSARPGMWVFIPTE